MNEQTMKTSLPAILTQTGVAALTQARANAVQAVVQEMAAALPLWQASQKNDAEITSLPEWVRALDKEATQPDGSVRWDNVRQHTSKRTAELLASTQLADKVTVQSLADFLGINLDEFADEAWVLMGSIGPQLSKGAL